MVIHRRPLVVLPAIAILAACRASGPPAAIDAALSARVPTATVALAGVDLDRLRAAPLYAKLPAGALEFLQTYGRAHHVLIAFSGSELLTVARGSVPGSTQIAPDVALSGAPDLVAAASAVHPPARVLAPAESVAAGSPIWLVVRGGVLLPLEGDLSNVNNLLRGVDYVTLALQLGDPAEFRVVAYCTAPDAAQRFEQSFRAVVSLAIATTARQAATTALLNSIQIARTERVVHVSLSTPLDALAKLQF